MALACRSGSKAEIGELRLAGRRVEDHTTRVQVAMNDILAVKL